MLARRLQEFSLRLESFCFLAASAPPPRDESEEAHARGQHQGDLGLRDGAYLEFEAHAIDAGAAGAGVDERSTVGERAVPKTELKSSELGSGFPHMWR